MTQPPSRDGSPTIIKIVTGPAACNDPRQTKSDMPPSGSMYLTAALVSTWIVPVSAHRIPSFHRILARKYPSVHQPWRTGISEIGEHIGNSPNCLHTASQLSLKQLASQSESNTWMMLSVGEGGNPDLIRKDPLDYPWQSCLPGRCSINGSRHSRTRCTGYASWVH